MKNKKLLILLLLFILFMITAAVLYRSLADKMEDPTLSPVTTAPNAEAETQSNTNTDSNTNPETEILKAPDFTIYDADGNAVLLSDFFGKPIVLNFWASWCGPCKSEMPEFNEVYTEYGNDIQFLMVNMTTTSRESLEKAKRYIEDAGYTFPVFYDLNGNAMQTYSVYSYPTTYFLNADGELVRYATGAISKETLLYAISLITE